MEQEETRIKLSALIKKIYPLADGTKTVTFHLQHNQTEEVMALWYLYDNNPFGDLVFIPRSTPQIGKAEGEPKPLIDNE